MYKLGDEAHFSYGITHYKICQLLSKLELENFVPASGFRKGKQDLLTRNLHRIHVLELYRDLLTDILSLTAWTLSEPSAARLMLHSGSGPLDSIV